MEAVSKKKYNSDSLLLNNSLKKYKEQTDSFPVADSVSYLNLLSGEFLEYQKQLKSLEDEATASAKSKLRLAFGICFGQFAGMGLGIFHFSSWDVVEPITWLVQAFWLMVGSTFYLN